MGGFGPFLGQAHHFNRFAKQSVPYAQKRYNDEAERLWGVLDNQLAGKQFVIGDDLFHCRLRHLPMGNAL